jgi:hypothetical protein
MYSKLFTPAIFSFFAAAGELFRINQSVTEWVTGLLQILRQECGGGGVLLRDSPLLGSRGGGPISAARFGKIGLLKTLL